MNFENTLKNLEETLTLNLESTLPNHKIREVYLYSVLPPGKLFRPLLVYSTAMDLKNSFTLNHSLLASAIEIHHAYTLVHDDLPSMDNDLTRRGRPTVHAKYGEWKAVLSGDALLNSSYAILSKINDPKLASVLRFVTWATGPKGLIHGQVLDLSLEMNQNIRTLIETHNLKTARLIQTSLITSALLSNASKKELYSLFRFGRALGISFQLIDDLTELCEVDIRDHELAINPWIRSPNEVLTYSICYLDKIHHFLKDKKHPHLLTVVADYLGKMEKIISTNTKILGTRVKCDLGPVMASLNSIRKS